MLLADPDRLDNEVEGAIDESRDVERGRADDTNKAGADRESEASELRSGPTCSHCKKPLPQKKMPVCPSCGYYAALGICIDLDEEWERLASGEGTSPSEADGKTQAKSHLEVWINLVPPWAWQLVAYNLIILVASIAVRLALPAGVVRTAWSFGQLLAGIALLVTCHVFAYLIAIVDDASLNFLDVVLKPLRIWKDVVRDLPNKLRIVSGASCGATAALAAMLIIGSLNYAVLLDWGFKQPPKQNLLGAIAARAQQVGVDDEGNLEDAMNDFVNKAGVTGEDEKDQGPKFRADCLIIGYTTGGSNPEKVTSLVLAREHLQKLIYVGTVRGSFDQELHDYLPQFREIPRKQPFVFVPIVSDAQWVQPYYTCRVKYAKEDQATGKLEGIQYDTILGKISF
jgi:hypothetical protein